MYCRYLTRPTRIYEVEKRWELANLRLVSKAFRRSATPRLFRKIVTNLTGYSRYVSLQRPLARLFELSRSECASCVREVLVNADQLICLFDSLAVTQDVEDLAALLPACLYGFQRLSKLSIYGPNYSYSSDEDAPFPDALRMLLTRTIEDTFRYIPFLELTDLELDLPAAHDFATLSKSSQSAFATPRRLPLEKLMHRLRHLAVTISDDSGPDGQRYFTKPITETQRAFPNDMYARGFFDFIGMATNLESLQIKCTHILDMDLLEITQLYNLRIMVLSDVKISFEKFSRLGEQNISRLRAIGLMRVDLKSGKWEAFLLRLCSFPSLDYFSINSSGYARDGESAQLAPGQLPECNKPQEIETLNFRDYHALGNLQRQIKSNRNAAGLVELPEDDLRRVHETPLENL